MSDVSKRILELTPEKIRLLANRLNRQQSRDSRGQIERQSRLSNVFPLSLTQERLWIVDQLRASNPAYNNSIASRFNSQVNLVVLEQVLNEIVRRHEALRTAFP